MLKIESEREDDGRWLAEVPSLAGVLAYGATEAEARAKVKALALRVIADRLEHGEALPTEIAAVFETA
jgi:predicted RNase H-like HicB family nuclease